MSNKNVALQQKKIDYLKRFYWCNNMTIRIDKQGRMLLIKVISKLYLYLHKDTNESTVDFFKNLCMNCIPMIFK